MFSRIVPITDARTENKIIKRQPGPPPTGRISMLPNLIAAPPNLDPLLWRGRAGALLCRTNASSAPLPLGDGPFFE